MILGVSVAELMTKDAVLSADLEGIFTTPHDAGSGAPFEHGLFELVEEDWPVAELARAGGRRRRGALAPRLNLWTLARAMMMRCWFCSPTAGRSSSHR